MNKAFVALALLFALSGCVVVWGRGYEVEAETSDWITIKYDDHFTSLDKVRQVAQASCDTHAKRAVIKEKSTSWGLTTVDFDCVPQ